jgi:RHS repeat-associated protein
VRRAFAGPAYDPSYSYDPYGVPLQSTASLTDFGFAGLVRHPDSGLYLATYRAYNSATGRWLSRDPLGEGIDPKGDLYWYVDNNPISRLDPAGQQSLLPFFARPPIVPGRFKLPRSGRSGKEGSKDIPDWCRGQRPYENESGKDFAKRLLDEKYGEGNYPRGPSSEFNKIQKYGDRSFENPTPAPPSDPAPAMPSVTTGDDII